MPRERLVRAATLKKVSLASDLANFEDNRSDDNEEEDVEEEDEEDDKDEEDVVEKSSTRKQQQLKRKTPSTASKKKSKQPVKRSKKTSSSPSSGSTSTPHMRPGAFTAKGAGKGNPQFFGKAKVTQKKGPRTQKMLSLGLMATWGKEGAEQGEAFKPATKTNKSRGATQSQVLGEAVPKISVLGRERVVPQAKVGQGKVRSKENKKGSTDLKTPGQSALRVLEFPDNALFVEKEALYCDACNGGHYHVGNKKTNVQTHVSGKSHEQQLARWQRGGSEHKVITELLHKFDDEKNPVGQTLDEKTRLHRVDVCCTLLEAGIPFEKLNNPKFRSMMEKAAPGHASALTSPSHMMELMHIPRELEKIRVNAETKGRHQLYIADGTTRVAEVYVCVSRFWLKNHVAQRVIRLRLLDHPLTGPENAWFLDNAVQATGGRWEYALGVAADRAATNGAAFGLIKKNCPDFKGLLIGCMPHTLSHVGEKSNLQVAAEFTIILTGMTHSTNSRACFKAHFDEPMKRFNKIRWCVRYEMQEQIALNFKSLEPWVRECEHEGHAPETTIKLRDLLTASKHTLRLELAMSIDVFDMFTRHTYTLEGDGLLIFKVADILEELTAHVQMVRQGGAGVPNTRSVAKDMISEEFGNELQAAQDTRVRQLIEEQLEKVECSFMYYEAKLVELTQQVEIFKACRLFDPSRIAMLCRDVNEVEGLLKLFPFFDDVADVVPLLVGLPALLVYVNQHPITMNSDGNLKFESWWTAAGQAGHNAWFAAATKVMVLQPSSAAAERVFSMLKNLMGEQQQNSALEDYQETSIMTRYNQLQRYLEDLVNAMD